jgi:hypothetical protein
MTLVRWLNWIDSDLYWQAAMLWPTWWLRDCDACAALRLWMRRWDLRFADRYDDQAGWALRAFRNELERLL